AFLYILYSLHFYIFYIICISIHFILSEFYTFYIICISIYFILSAFLYILYYLHFYTFYIICISIYFILSSFLYFLSYLHFYIFIKLLLVANIHFILYAVLYTRVCYLEHSIGFVI